MISNSDLVILASRDVYRMKHGETVMVNGTPYIVEKVNGYDKNKPYCPQYIIFKNDITEERAMVFNGTNVHEEGMPDVITDAQLIGDKIPAQFDEAVNAYEKEALAFGNIVAVAGNSLGGGLANYVSLKKDVYSVTYNPSILPGDAMKLSQNGKQINYISNGEPLDSVQRGANLANSRIPGIKNYINNTIGCADEYMIDHVGSHNANDKIAEVNGDTISYIIVREGYTPIITDPRINIAQNPFYANMGLDTSIAIEINLDTLTHFKKSIQQMENINDLAKSYINASINISTEQVSYESFEEKQEMLTELLKNIVKFDAIMDCVRKIYAFKSNISLTLANFDILDLIINTILIKLDLYIESFESMCSLANDIFFREQQINQNFLLALNCLFKTIDKNSINYGNKLDNFSQQIADIISNYENFDLDIQSSIKNATTIKNNLHSKITPTNTILYEQLDFHKSIVVLQEDILDSKFTEFLKSKETIKFKNTFKEIKNLISILEKTIRGGLECCSELVEFGAPFAGFYNAMLEFGNNIAIARNPNLLEDKEKNDQRIEEDRRQLKEKLIEFNLFQEKVFQLLDIVREYINKIDNLDDILFNLSPYIKTLILSEDTYNDIIMYSTSALNIYKTQLEVFNYILGIEVKNSPALLEIKDVVYVHKNFLQNLIEDIDLLIITN